jgi:predicted secreted protein with PEFG-CTERM motif
LNKIPLAVFSILLVLPMVTMNVFGEASIELKSYNTSIDPNGNVLVIGKISGAVPHIPVKLTISDPSGKTIYSPNVQFDGDGNFKYLIKPTLPQFPLGTYTVEATHRDLETPVQLQFEVMSVAGGSTDIECSENEFDADGYCIPYDISGTTVTSASLNLQSKSIVIILDDDAEEGTLTIKPSSDIIQGIFMVLVDGEESNNVTITGNEVTIMFPEGTSEIEVIGTFVIPEFGTIAMIILGMSIIGIVFMTGRFKVFGFPKI